jgi:phage/plasmid-associated DNA primase
LNIVAELPARDFTESEPFKSAIAGDLMDARPIKREPFMFVPCAGHIYSANTLPGTTDQTHGFWRRMVVIMFLRTFDGADADVGLAERIIETERAAIVAWALRGAQRLLQQGRYTEPASSMQNVQAWRERSDDVRAFLDDLAFVKLQADELQSHGFAPSDLHAAYRAWAAECGTETTLSGKAFGQRLRLLGFEARHDETKAPRRRYRLRHPTPAEREAILRERAAKEARRV